VLKQKNGEGRKGNDQADLAGTSAFFLLSSFRARPHFDGQGCQLGEAGKSMADDL